MSLILDCLNSPADEAPRLMLADYAQERGDDRAVEVLGLTRKLILAADNPEYNWVPKAEEPSIPLGCDYLPTKREENSVLFIKINDRWHRKLHRPQPWLPSDRPRHLGRAFAAAVIRWRVSLTPPEHRMECELHNIATACELSAAGLIDHKERDKWLLKIGIYHESRQFESFGIAPIWNVANMARSGSLGHIQHIVAWGTKDARNLFHMNEKNRRTRPENSVGWHRVNLDFITNHCLDRSHHTPLLRMVGCLRQHMGLSL